MLAASTAAGEIYLWDAASGRSLGPPLAGNQALMRGLAFSPDGRVLTAGSGPSILLWDVAEPEGAGSALGSPMAGGRGAVGSVAFHPEGEVVAIAMDGDGEEIRFLDARGGARRAEALTAVAGAIGDLVFSPDGTLLAGLSSDETRWQARLWNWRDGTGRTALEQEIADEVGQDPARRRLLSELGDFARILEQALEPEEEEGCTPVRALAFAGDLLVATEGASGGHPGWLLRGWELDVEPEADADVSAGDGPAALQGDEIDGVECVHSLAIDVDGGFLAAGTDRGLVALFDLIDFEPVGSPLRGHVLPVRSLAFSPGGQLLASGGDEGTVHVWDLLGDLERPLVLAGHTSTVQALAFDPRRPVLASAGSDRTIILWDVETGLAIGRPLAGHRGAIGSLAFSPDGMRLVSGGEDGVWLWQLDPRIWCERARRVANRNLTPVEIELYLGSSDQARAVDCSRLGSGS